MSSDSISLEEIAKNVEALKAKKLENDDKIKEERKKKLILLLAEAEINKSELVIRDAYDFALKYSIGLPKEVMSKMYKLAHSHAKDRGDISYGNMANTLAAKLGKKEVDYSIHQSEDSIKQKARAEMIEFDRAWN